MRRLSILAFLAPLFSFGQGALIHESEPEWVFRNEKDSTANFYLVLRPRAEARGLMVILPGFGGFPVRTLEETDLPVKAQRHGYVVVIPHLAPQTFYTDSVTQKRLRTLIPEVMDKYRVPARRFVIGGHSAGGNGALLYAGHAYMANDPSIVKPDIVFAVDAPLDITRLWSSFQFIKALNFSKTAVDEAEYFLNRFRSELGGTPSQMPLAYQDISSFSRDAQDGGKIKYLRHVPIRLYCDPDIQWYMENRRMPYEHINAADLSACIVRLKMLGNAKAELVTNIGKGFFPDGRRHPHAFSQVDAEDLLQWVDTMLNK